MGKLVLVNDVETDIGKSGLIVGAYDAAVSEEGAKQAEKLAKFLCDKVGKISLVIASDTVRSRKVLHHIRVYAKNLSPQKIRKSKDVRERDFGVLTCSSFYLNSDLFKHSRICAEGGESISQCQSRVLSYIELICQNLQLHRTVILTHPFVCQILTNAFLKQAASNLNEFWFNKASFAEFGFELHKYGLQWCFGKAYNALNEQQYAEDDLKINIHERSD